MATELYYIVESDGFGYKAFIYSLHELVPVAKTGWHLSYEMAEEEAEQMIRRFE